MWVVYTVTECTCECLQYPPSAHIRCSLNVFSVQCYAQAVAISDFHVSDSKNFQLVVLLKWCAIIYL